MVARSIYKQILDACKDTLQNVGMPTILNDNIVVRKLPKVDEQIETLPTVCIVPSDSPPTWIHHSFEFEVNFVYSVSIVVVALGNRDLVTNLDREAQWMELARQAFGQPPLNYAPTVWKTQISPEPLYDRSNLNMLYDYLGVSAKFHSTESRNIWNNA